ncbi:dihydrodipicolinate synthase family protein [Bradyrhizobium sp. BRP14]|nr:dihydrodipicolinate synthase family protein [Bradyrhizobium sp. BRP14]
MTAEPIGIWAAIPTPFSPSLELDEPGLRHNARHYIGLGLRGVFCNGLIGEVWAMTLAERKRVVEVLVEEGRGKLGVSTVISASSIHETLELGAHAKEAGADHAVIMVPTSGPRSREQQFEYVKLICDTLDMPIVIFNAAGATGSPLSPELFSDICTLPQIVMLKTTAYDHNTALRKAAHGKVVVSDPLEEHFLENRLQSEQPILYADPEPYLYQFPGVCPIADYVGQLDRGENDAARAARERLEPLRRAFNKWVMNPLIEGHMPNAAVKRWSEMMGMAGGAVRAPIRPLSPIEKQTLEHEVRIAFEQSGLPNPEIAYA